MHRQYAWYIWQNTRYRAWSLDERRADKNITAPRCTKGGDIMQKLKQKLFNLKVKLLAKFGYFINIWKKPSPSWHSEKAVDFV